MAAEIIELEQVTKLDLPPERILRKATEAGLTGVVVVGYDADGDFYFASSYADGVLWLTELAKKKLLEIGDPDGQ